MTTYRTEDLELSSEFDPELFKPTWEIIRCPKGGRSRGIIVVSSKLVGLTTHCANKRTVPHLKANCDACEHGWRREWHGYFLAVDAKDESKLVVEVTAGGAAPLVNHLKKHKTIRGLMVVLRRRGTADQSPQILVINGTTRFPERLVVEEDIFPVLFRIWRIKVDLPIDEQDFSADALNERERELANLAVGKEKHDSAWMEARRLNLAGQINFLQQEEARVKKATNGHSPITPS